MKTTIELQIMEAAKRRIGFKIHFLVFFLLLPVNWIVWYLTDTSYLWPIWPTLGWSLGILFHWLGAFHAGRLFSLTKEYENLLQKEIKVEQKQK